MATKKPSKVKVNTFGTSQVMLKSNVKSYHSLFIRFGFEILAKKKKEEKKKGQSHKMKKS